MRSSAFFINGGAGRVICSIPALEKYEQENPDDDFIIVCEGGMDMYKGHTSLHKRAFDNWHKGLFEEKIKDRNCITPEPYRVWEYYNQKCNLTQAFDIAISNKGLRELKRPDLVLDISEITAGKNVVREVREKTGKDKTIVIQPFGRSVEAAGSFVIDPSGRSIEWQNLVNFIKKLEDEYAIILMSEMSFSFEHEGVKNPVAQPRDVGLRQWAGIIKAADYFFGCDSVGQHIAYTFDKPATIIVGSTFAENISYPKNEKFDIQDMGEGKRIYDPIRIVMDEYSQKQNSGIMLMNDAIEKVIVESLNNNFKKWVKVVPLPTKTEKSAPDNQEEPKLKLVPGLGSK